MTDAVRLTVAVPPPEPLFALELWGDPVSVQARLAFGLPSPCRAALVGEDRVLWWEPGVWLIRTSAADRVASLARLADGAGDQGAVTDLSGAFTRVRLQGPAWRELLMIGAVFDAEAPAFGPGSVAGTVIHHLQVRLDVIDPLTVDAYTPPSYAADLIHHWTRAARRLA